MLSKKLNPKSGANVLAAVALAQGTTPEALVAQIANHAAETATSRDQERVCAKNVIDNTNNEAARRLERAQAEAAELIRRAQAMVIAAETENSQQLSQAGIIASQKLGRASELDATVRQLNSALQSI